MTPYYITLNFLHNISTVIEPSSGNYNVRDYTWYKGIQYSVLPLKVSLVIHHYRNGCS